MNRTAMVLGAGIAALLLVGIKVGALPNPLNKAPSFARFNSVTVKKVSAATAGQALVADGNAASKWANVEGADIASNVSGSPAANGAVLTANGAGQASWSTLKAPGAEENLRILRGVVSGGGGLLVGSGFTITKGAAASGQYTITFNTPFNGAPTVVATADLDGRVISTVGATSNSANFQISISGTGAHTDAAFHVIAIGPR